MTKLSQIWFEVQQVLFPFIEKEIEEPLKGMQKKPAWEEIKAASNA